MQRCVTRGLTLGAPAAKYPASKGSSSSRVDRHHGLQAPVTRLSHPEILTKLPVLQEAAEALAATLND